MSKKLVYIGFAFYHHKNSEGGYHHIREYVDYDIVINLQKERDFIAFSNYPLLNRVIKKIKYIILGEGTPIGILRLLYLNLTNRNLVFHFIYPEISYKWLGKFLRKTNKIAFTLHQPFDIYNNKTWKGIFEHVQIIIVLKENDVKKFKKFTGINNVYYIPHGLNTSYFKPSNETKVTNRIIMVGSWLRNFELASAIFNKLKILKPNIDIVVVADKRNYKYFDANSVRLVSNISNDQLLKYYQSSKLAFFPLNDFTANNALLEAAGTGCHILISTPKSIISEYFPRDLITVKNEDVQSNVDSIMEILNTKSETNYEIAEYTRMEYSWESIGAKVQKLLSEC